MSIVGRRGSNEIFEYTAAIGAGTSASGFGGDFYLPRISEAGTSRCGDAGVFYSARIPRVFCGTSGHPGMYWRGAATDRAVHAARGVGAGGGDGDCDREGQDGAWSFLGE